MRRRIRMQSGRIVLVRGGNRAPADAGRGRGLPVPGMPAQGGCTTRQKRFSLTRKSDCKPRRFARKPIERVKQLFAPGIDGIIIIEQPVRRVGKAERAHRKGWPGKSVGTAQARLCPPYDLNACHAGHLHAQKKWVRRPSPAMTNMCERYFTTAAVCPNKIFRSSSVRLTGWPKFGLTSFALA